MLYVPGITLFKFPKVTVKGPSTFNDSLDKSTVAFEGTPSSEKDVVPPIVSIKLKLNSSVSSQEVLEFIVVSKAIPEETPLTINDTF